jgi:hypothetical protein
LEEMKIDGNNDFIIDDEEEEEKKESAAMYDPMLIEELEDIYHDAHDHIVQSFVSNNHYYPSRKEGAGMMRNGHRIEEEEEKDGDESRLLLQNREALDPPRRECLPFLKDPKIKISIWTILKDSIGKDISKISVPVYFNQPLSIL